MRLLWLSIFILQLDKHFGRLISTVQRLLLSLASLIITNCFLIHVANARNWIHFYWHLSARFSWWPLHDLWHKWYRLQTSLFLKHFKCLWFDRSFDHFIFIQLLTLQYGSTLYWQRVRVIADIILFEGIKKITWIPK